MNRTMIIAAALAVMAPAVITVGTGVAAGAAGSSLTSYYCQLGTAAVGTSDGHGGTLDAAQIGNAQIIYEVADQMKLPFAAAVIALAAALRESDLVNLTTATNLDSLGLFQQRPSQGWGTPAQVTNPIYASTAFYDHLIKVPGWQSMPPGQAAQAVQRSAAPGAYARWVTLATKLAATFANEAASCPAGIPPVSGLGAATVAYAERQFGLPYQYGGGSFTGPTAGFNSAGTGQPGWDCSGLTMYAVYHATHGQVALPHNAAAQFASSHIQLVSYSQLQPGDLVFFPGSDGTYASPGHVGIYVGHQLVIDAPYTGVSVRFDSIAPGSGLYATFIAGGRVIP